MKLTKKKLSATESLLVVGVLLIGAACIYAAYRMSSSALHRRSVSAAIPKYLTGLKADRQKLSAAIQRYYDHFGFYPPNRSTNLSTRALNNALYYELIGTRWNSNLHSFGLPTTKEPVQPTEMLKAFNMASFSNTLTFPAWPANFLDGLGFAGREENDLILVVSGAPDGIADDIIEDFSITPWRYSADPATHNKGKFDLWMELDVLGQRFEIQNWSQD